MRSAPGRVMYFEYVASIIAVEESTLAATNRTGMPFSKHCVMKLCRKAYAVASFGSIRRGGGDRERGW